MIDSSSYQEKSQQIRQLASLPPDALINHLADSHKALEEVAPNILPHIHSTAINAIQFLNGKLPPSGNELVGDKPIEPSIAQQKEWLDLHKTVNDPSLVLEHIKKGTLNHNHVAAIQSVYPELHQDIVQKIQTGLGNNKINGKVLPYHQRLSMGLMTGMPVDSTMTPMSMQSTINANRPNSPQAQKASGQKKAGSSELKQIDQVNKMYETPLQKREANTKD